MPQVIIELSVEERRLLQGYREAVKSDKALRDAVDATGEAGKQSGKKIANGMLAGAKATKEWPEAVKKGSTDSQAEIKALIKVLRKMGPEGQQAAKELSKHLALAGREGVESVDDILDEIEKIDTVAAKNARRAKDEFGKLDDKQKQTVGPNGLSLISKYAAGWVSVAGGIAGVAEAMRTMQATNEAALDSLLGVQSGDRRLLQIADSENGESYKELRGEADRLAMDHGITRAEARNLVFSSRSEDFAGATDFISKNHQAIDPAAAAVVAGSVPGLFPSEGIKPEQAINVMLRAAAESKADFEELTAAAPLVAEGASMGDGVKFTEAVGFLSALAGSFSTTQVAGGRLKTLFSKMGLDRAVRETDADGNVTFERDSLASLTGVQGIEKIRDWPEEKRRDFLGENAELNGIYTVALKMLPEVKARVKVTAEEYDLAFTDNSTIAKRTREANTVRETFAVNERAKAGNKREVAQERERAVSEAGRQTKRDLAFADAEQRGASKISIAAAEMVEDTRGVTSPGVEVLKALQYTVGLPSLLAGEGVKKLAGVEESNEEVIKKSLPGVKVPDNVDDVQLLILGEFDVSVDDQRSLTDEVARAAKRAAGDSRFGQRRAEKTTDQGGEVAEAFADSFVGRKEDSINPGLSPVLGAGSQVLERMLDAVEMTANAAAETAKSAKLIADATQLTAKAAESTAKTNQETATNTKPRGIDPHTAMRAAIATGDER